MTKPVVGIDVGKAKLDVGLADEKRVRVWANDEAGRAELSDWVVEQEVVTQRNAEKSQRRTEKF